jgi:hypothetical protein
LACRGESFEDEPVIAGLEEIGIEADRQRVIAVGPPAAGAPETAAIICEDRGAIGLMGRLAFEFE